MQKAVVILIIFLLGLGVTQPSGILQPFDIRERYEHCSHEDHDITPLDFIFEHLLNLESIVNIIEGEHEYHPGDEPHEPFQLMQSASEITIGMPGIPIEIHMVYHTERAIQYPIHNRDLTLSHFCSDILRPPIAS